MATAARFTLALVGSLLTGAVVHADPLLLDRSPDKVIALSLADSNRDEPGKEIAIHGPWRIVQTAGGVRTWETENPIRPRTLFFHRAPQGMKLKRVRETGTPKSLTIGADFNDATDVDTWKFSSHGIQVRRPLGDGPPEAGEYILRYPKAIVRERDLNRELADIPDDKAFTFRSLQVDDTSRRGLFLPAPSEIGFQITIPHDGVLRFDARIVPPEAAIPGEQSDGAVLTISVDGEEIARRDIDADEQTHRIALKEWGDQTVTLSLATAPGETSLLDYVFIAEPTIYVPQKDPPRVVILFIDTLRPDHMSLYGYDRPTSPQLDAWAKDAAVFTEARSIAPWTLPSTRTMLTGSHPERWDKVPHLQNKFAAAGWATAFIAGNVYLSSNFQMAEGWGLHRCINWPQASVQVDRALRYLSDHSDEPVFMMLHIMDMHLPYTEPITHRYRFAGKTPESIGKDYFLRKAVTRGAKTEESRQYVRDRYDNNMRYIDDHVARVLEKLDDNDTVVVLSDHGEEFWDHNGFEHGHTLYDELLRVPMVIKGPGVSAGRYDEPVSLLDVAPTLAGVAGLGTEGMVGWDLRSLTNGTHSADFRSRPHAFGRPLYGLRQWGSLKEGKKYTVSQGRERVYDLKTDPAETKNIVNDVETSPFLEAMAQALDRPVVPAWRIVPDRKRESVPARVTLRNPAGIRAAWAGVDPTHSGRANVTLTGDTVVARWPKQRSRVEAFVVPGPAGPDMPPAEVQIKVGNKTKTVGLNLSAASKPGMPKRLLREQVGGRTIEITSTVAPIPTEADGDINGFDAEVAGDLESLGYVGD